MSDTGTTPGRPGRPRAVLAAIVVVGCLLVGWALSGGRGSGGAAPAGGGSASVTAAAPTGGGPSPGTQATSSRSGSPGAPPAGPGGAQAADRTAGFLTELGAIDPALVADRDRVVRAGQTTCQDIKANKPHDVLVRDARQRFDGGGTTVDKVKASLIVDAARNHLCP